MSYGQNCDTHLVGNRMLCRFGEKMHDSAGAIAGCPDHSTAHLEENCTVWFYCPTTGPAALEIWLNYWIWWSEVVLSQKLSLHTWHGHFLEVVPQTEGGYRRLKFSPQPQGCMFHRFLGELDTLSLQIVCLINRKIHTSSYRYEKRPFTLNISEEPWVFTIREASAINYYQLLPM